MGGERGEGRRVTRESDEREEGEEGEGRRGLPRNSVRRKTCLKVATGVSTFYYAR